MSTCPICGGQATEGIYRVAGVPANSCLLMPDAESAQRVARGQISLSACEECSFVWNAAFDAQAVNYVEGYEETQMFSRAFRDFQDALAQQLVEDYDLQHKRILEIGSGKGDFIARLCDLGKNEGLAFDPTFDPERNPDVHGRVRYVRELFSGQQLDFMADLIICKMTLEHIANPLEIVETMKAGARPDGRTLLFIQVPDAKRILDQGAFWDIYHEHCNYFTKESLIQLLINAGFKVLDIWRDYGGQYLMVVARSAAPSSKSPRLDPGGPGRAVQFAERSSHNQRAVSEFFEKRSRAEEAVAIWGSGSKAVALLTSLEQLPKIDMLIDINPHRQGTFLPGTALEIQGPENLRGSDIDAILIMNEVYRDEISNQVRAMGIDSEIYTIDRVVEGN